MTRLSARDHSHKTDNLNQSASWLSGLIGLTSLRHTPELSKLADESRFGRRNWLNAWKRTPANRNRVGCCRWEPPASAGGSDASASRKESHFDPSGFSPGLKTPRLKPEANSPTRAARLESRAPPHECGGSHPGPSVRAPCFSWGSDALTSREESQRHRPGFSLDFARPVEELFASWPNGQQPNEP